jgi:hypothetical protein
MTPPPFTAADPAQAPVSIKSPFPHLSDKHYRELSIGSGLCDAIILAAKFRTLEGTPENRQFLYGKGYRGKQLELFPLLYCPYFDTEGVEFSQIKSDCPRLDEDGQPIKYETATVGGYGVACPPGKSWMEKLMDPRVPIWLVEGLKKAAALWQVGILAIAIPGVWMHRIGRKTDPDQPLLPGLARIPWQGRTLITGYDSDLRQKLAVWLANVNVAQEMRAVGANVRYCVMPPLPNGDKCGIDDYLLDHTVEQLDSCVMDELPPRPKPGPGEAAYETQALRRVANDLRVRRGQSRHFAKISQSGACALVDHALALSVTGVEIAKAVCAAEQSEEVSLDHWYELKNATMTCYQDLKTFGPYLIGRLYGLYVEKVRYGKKADAAQNLFGNMTISARKWWETVQAFAPDEWQWEIPIEFHKALKDQPARVREKAFEEWHQRRYQPKNQYTARELKQRLGLTEKSEPTDAQYCVKVVDDPKFWAEFRRAIDEMTSKEAIACALRTWSEAREADHEEFYGPRDEHVPHPAETAAQPPMVDYGLPSWDEVLQRDREAEEEERNAELATDSSDNFAKISQSSEPAEVLTIPEHDDSRSLIGESRGEEERPPPPVPPIRDQRPYSDLVRLAETGVLPNSPLRLGAKCLFSGADFRAHVLSAASHYAKEQSHYWLTELSAAQKIWSNYTRQARDHLYEGEELSEIAQAGEEVMA